MGWFIVFIVLIAISCFIIYHEAEVHELHKMRAAFSDIKHRIEHVKAEYEKHQVTKDIVKDSFEEGVVEGELKELDEVINVVDTELEKVKIR